MPVFPPIHPWATFVCPFPSLPLSPNFHRNRRREANPLATLTGHFLSANYFRFQSQTRSQSPGDIKIWSARNPRRSVSIADAKPIPWRPGYAHYGRAYVDVSIADAKPIPWRHVTPERTYLLSERFNRRREANPLATPSCSYLAIVHRRFQSQTRSQSPGDLGRT